MSFMKSEVTTKQTWLKIDGSNGITFAPIDVLEANRKAFLLLSAEQQLETVQVYYEGTPESVELIKGYGARLSAPGYLDCTEWTVFDTAEEAEAYLAEEYGDEDDDSAMYCDQCQVLMINGVFCHETGCPNSGKRYEDGEWIRYHECRECGCDVREGDECCNPEHEPDIEDGGVEDIEE